MVLRRRCGIDDPLDGLALMQIEVCEMTFRRRVSDSVALAWAPREAEKKFLMVS
jgi:hypothetical protein